jgi:hypothetical protein
VVGSGPVGERATPTPGQDPASVLRATRTYAMWMWKLESRW